MKLYTFDPTSNTSAYSLGDNVANAGVIIPYALLRSIRNAVVLDFHVPREMRDRPEYYFAGAAEYSMLTPLAQAVKLSPEAPIEMLLRMAHNTAGTLRILNLSRSKIGVGAIAQAYSSTLPSSKANEVGIYLRPDDQNPNGPGSGMKMFSGFLSRILTDGAVRKSVIQTVTQPGYKINNASYGLGPVNYEAIMQQFFDSFEVFALRGKATPLFGSEVDFTLSQRFVVEDFISGSQSAEYAEDNQLASAIWYLMYSQIVKTPEAYDSAFPVVPLSPQDGVIATSALSLLGSVARTAYSAATAPLYLDACLSIRMLKEAIEFLETGPTYKGDYIEKAKKALAEADASLGAAAYPPVVTLANTICDYLKKLTSSRYLLPEWFRSVQTATGEYPFSTLPKFQESPNLPKGYLGYVPGDQRQVTFGGLDLPRIASMVYSKAQDVTATLAHYKHLYDTVFAGLPSPSGDVLAHLNTLGSITPDPPLGEISYATPTDTYLIPTYVSKFKTAANGVAEWSFKNLLYQPFFPLRYQMAEAKANITTPAYAFDTEVKVPASPATGADFACLTVPASYFSDCYPSQISNNMQSVKAFLSASPHRPMSDIADYFLPLFQALSAGLSRTEVIANAISAMFSLYERKVTKTADGSMASSDWNLVLPSVPFIYGYPTKSLMQANAPWSDRAPAGPEHKHFSPDGKYALVLHRLMPKPMTLRTIPYTLTGGLKVSLPVGAQYYESALSKISGANKTDIQVFYREALRELSNVTATNDLTPVTGWLKAYAYFPHLFATNRNVASISGDVLTELPKLASKIVLTTDSAFPIGAALTYVLSPVEILDGKEQNDALLTSESTFDVNSEVQKKSHKAVVDVKPEAPPTSTPPSVETLNKEKEAKNETTEKTNMTEGTVTESVAPIPGSSFTLDPGPHSNVSTNEEKNKE